MVTFERLGPCLRAQGKPSTVADADRTALALAKKLEQTNDVKQAAVVAAVRGNREAREQVEQLCAQLAQSADWKNLAAAIQRILAGEWDYEALADALGLTYDAALIVQRRVEGANE